MKLVNKSILYKQIYSVVLNRLFVGVLSTLLLTCITTLNVSARSSNDKVTLTVEEKLWIATHSVVNSSNNTANAPIDFVSAGAPAGMSIDYLNLIADKVGLKINYVNYETWSDSLNAAKNKELDLIHTISFDDERSKYFNFSDTYYNVPIAKYGLLGSAKINSIDDLRDKRIGLIKDYIVSEAYRNKHPDFNYVEFNNELEVIRALSLNKIDIYSGEVTVIDYIISQNNILNLEIVGEDFIMDNNVIDLRIAIHKDNPILMNIINKGMAAVTDEEFAAISEKWIKSQPVNYDIGLTKEELAWLNSHPIIKVGANIEVKPIEFVDADGTIRGIAGDYLDEISRLLNIKFEWVGNQTWDEALTLAKNGRIDLLSAAVLTEEREKYLDFTDSYLTIANMIFTQTGKGIYENLESLEGLSISAETGDVNVENIKLNHPDITVIEANSAAEAIKLAAIGAADAYVGGLPTTSFYMAEESITNISAVGETPYISKLSMGVPKGNLMLVSILNKAIRSISQKRKSEIVSKWYSLKIENKLNYQLIINLSIAGTLLLAFIMYWNDRLRKEVLDRKKVEEKLIILHRNTAAASSAKSTFLANISHEIRTPLNAIIGFSGLMMLDADEAVNRDKSKDKEYLEHINESGHNLLDIINDILDISKVEAGKIETFIEEFDAVSEIENCVASFYTMRKGNGVTINSELEETTLLTDEKLFRQIMRNILSNAIKFTPKGGTVSITNQFEEKFVHFSISDSGIGMDDDEIKVAFEPFGQVQSTYSKEYQGTGLGLPLVNKFMEVLGGKIYLSSQKYIGTTVKLSFPI